MGESNVRSGVVAAVLSSVVAAAAVAIVVTQLGSGDGSGVSRDQVTSLDSRLTAIESELVGVSELKSEIAKLSGELRRVRSRSSGRGNGRSEAIPSGDGAPASATGGNAEIAADEIREASGEEGLRTFIARVMDEKRDSERQAAIRRQQEHQRRIEEMHQGPYGKHNYKVNSTADRLDFNDRQKQSYYDLVVAYTDRVSQARADEKADPKNRQLYRDRRKEIRSEFGRYVVQMLNPEQKEVYDGLNSWEKRPDTTGVTSSYMFMTSDAPVTGTPVRSLRVASPGAVEHVELELNTALDRVHQLEATTRAAVEAEREARDAKRAIESSKQK